VAGSQSITLRPLSDAQASSLTANLLGDDASIRELAALVRDRAAGNPFFVEEIVRDLNERGVLGGQPGAYELRGDTASVDVPATLQATIAARIDRLEPTAKQTLNAAAVVGSRFDTELLTTLIDSPDALDGVDTLSDAIGELIPQMDKLEAIMPQMVKMLTPMVTMMKSMHRMMLSMHSTMAGQQDQSAAMQSKGNAMGQAFDTSKNDDSFYLPPEVFDNPDFKRGMNMFISPDGKAVRFIISHLGDPATVEGIGHVDAIRNAAFEAIKGTPLENARIYIAGTAATAKDMKEGSTYDLLIAGVGALVLIFIVMLVLTRAVIAAAVIVGTVLLSLGASFGLSVLIWQYILGFELHWFILAMSVIILLAVGSDYNLLLVSRFKEEINAGIKTGIIRSMAGTGAVVTSAGLVFAFTMISMAASALLVIGQVGTTIGLGLLFDTLVVRSFMTPSIAALLGRWFWWPQRVRTRPIPIPTAPQDQHQYQYISA
jgi:RND superfamily putative drug exporter